MDDGKKKAYDKFTRTGLAIKGVIYVLSGILAIIAATGPGGKTFGRMGVLRWIAQQPFGSVLLVLLATGLTGYVVLRLMQAFRDTNHKGSSWKGLSRRAGYFISGLVYLAFLIASFYLLFPEAGVWKKEEISYINKALQLPAGNIAVAIAGAFTLGYGLFEIVRGIKRSFNHHLSFQHVKKNWKRLLTAIGAFGYVARGVILCLAGFFIARSAFQAYVEKAHFTSKALAFLSAYLGTFVMAIVAGGLALYGIFMFVKAKYYQVSIK